MLVRIITSVSSIKAEHGLMRWYRNHKPEVGVESSPAERDEDYQEQVEEHAPVGLTTPILGEYHFLPPYSRTAPTPLCLQSKGIELAIRRANVNHAIGYH